MSSKADGTPEQRAFGNWVSESLAYLKETRGLSMRKACQLAGVSHTQVYAWMGQPESTGYVDASPEAVRKFCRAHRLDYAEAARILGWDSRTAKPAPETPRDLEGFIRRAKRMAEHPGTSEERRRELEARITDAEAAVRMQKMAEELLREALGEDADQ